MNHLHCSRTGRGLTQAPRVLPCWDQRSVERGRRQPSSTELIRERWSNTPLESDNDERTRHADIRRSLLTSVTRDMTALPRTVVGLERDTKRARTSLYVRSRVAVCSGARLRRVRFALGCPAAALELDALASPWVELGNIGGGGFRVVAQIRATVRGRGRRRRWQRRRGVGGAVRNSSRREKTRLQSPTARGT